MPRRDVLVDLETPPKKGRGGPILSDQIITCIFYGSRVCPALGFALYLTYIIRPRNRDVTSDSYTLQRQTRTCPFLAEAFQLYVVG